MVRSSGISQAIYYAKNIKASAAGANTVTVTFNASTAFVDLRITEYSGLDKVNPLDVSQSASGTAATANSGAVTTTAANELLFAAGTTTGSFSGAGTGFTNRIITSPDADNVEDRLVTAADVTLQRDRIAGRVGGLGYADGHVQSGLGYPYRSNCWRTTRRACVYSICP